MTGMSTHAKRITLKPWQVAALTILILTGCLGLATYAAAASYESVSGAAVAHHVPLPLLNPLGLDGGLFIVITVDIALTLIGHPIWWLRLVARLFAIGTIAANAAAGWPDPVGVGLRIAAPALFVVLIEVARTILLRLHRTDDGPRFTLTRWALAPRQTFAIWKRDRLWDAAELAKLAPAEAPSPTTARNAGRNRKRKRAGTTARKPQRTSAPAAPAEADFDTEAEALRILAAEPGISGSQLGLRLGKSDGYGRQLHRKLVKTPPEGSTTP